MDNVVHAIQYANELTLSQGVTRIAEDDHRLKLILEASNDAYWLTTIGPNILEVKIRNEVKWRWRIRKKKNFYSTTGKDSKSLLFGIKVEAGMALHSFRVGQESTLGKKSVLKT